MTTNDILRGRRLCVQLFWIAIAAFLVGIYLAPNPLPLVVYAAMVLVLRIYIWELMDQHATKLGIRFTLDGKVRKE